MNTPLERLDLIIHHVESWTPAGDGFLDDLRVVRAALAALVIPAPIFDGHVDLTTGKVTGAWREAPSATRIKAGLAALHWYETTHGNGFEHDHHCSAGKWESPGEMTRADGSTFPRTSVQVETGKPCTCGWGPFQEAMAALNAAEGR